jgi:hypothetical protein
MPPYRLWGAALLLLAGCGEGSGPEGPRAAFPALNESPPPPMVRAAERPVAPSPAATAAPPTVIVEDAWMQRQLKKEEQLKSLRDYAARAGPDDPFVLSEERIKALEAQGDLMIH